MDLMGLYPRMNREQLIILVGIDCFSRWTETYPLGTATSKSIAKMLERKFFSRFGYPQVVLSDIGPQFRSNCMRNCSLDNSH